MKRLLVAFCLVFAVGIPASSILGASIVHAANVANDVNVPLAGTVVNPCTGEAYTFTGYGHLLIHVTGDMAGGFHLDSHFNTQGIQLVGANGDTGVGNEADHATLNLNPGAANETQNGHFDVISQGSTPNFFVTYLLHITVNADGTVTAFADHFAAACRG